MAERIEFTSENGYRGIMYGESGMVIFSPDGKLVLHTTERAVNTSSELKNILDTMPEFMKRLEQITGVQ